MSAEFNSIGIDAGSFFIDAQTQTVDGTARDFTLTPGLYTFTTDVDLLFQLIDADGGAVTPTHPLWSKERITLKVRQNLTLTIVQFAGDTGTAYIGRITT